PPSSPTPTSHDCRGAIARVPTTNVERAGGPLAGTRVLVVGGIGPSTFAAMVLADLRADVVRVARRDAVDESARRGEFLVMRGSRSVALDLKSAGGRDVLLGLADAADVLVEGFRPGVAERLGVGPEDCRARNDRLVYARMTGWGQD